MTPLKHYLYPMAIAAGLCSIASCADEKVCPQYSSNDAAYVGKAVGNFTADEWNPGGALGTTDNVYAGCYEDETPATQNQGLMSAFFEGEGMFERSYTINNAPYKGLGPASVRRSCLDCHPNYGHGKRKDAYETKYGNGNGYLLVIYHPTEPGSNDGPYISEVTAMPQTQANSPFLPPIDESQIQLQWHNVTSMESGLAMQFPDGEKFELIYPELSIPQSAFNTSPKPENIAFRLESTIGIIGTGMLDAIDESDIKAQYKSTAEYYSKSGKDVSEYINPSFWDAATNDFASGAYYKLNPGQLADGSAAPEKMIKRYTYALTRATLQDGPGANAIWNITNVSRPDRPNLYTTDAWAQAMSENKDVISAIKADPTSPYYADGSDAGIANAVKTLLSPKTNQFDNDVHNFKPDMTTDQFYSLMVWHRGLSIPRARNLNDADTQRGKEVFMQIGCSHCHRPSWTTGDDNYWVPASIAGRELPQYKHQKIYPYTDLMQHKLYMKNDIHGSWCRTTPLWGRGLSQINTGAEDRLHDCRARNEVEAIMWHAYSKKSHAYSAALKFYNLPKSDRDAVVKFLRSI